MIRPELPALPERMRDLPVDKRGYPVPAFVATVEGEYDFRIADAVFKEKAQRLSICYVCGNPFTTRHRWYPIGPMCVINRTTSEPAVHRECAVFSAKGCPFLTRPHAGRRANGLPETSRVDEAGIARNPGVTALYQTRTCEVLRRSSHAGDFLVLLGDPEEVRWYARGRQATYAEVVASIHSGYPLLVESAREEGMPALEALRRVTYRALPLLPVDDTRDDDEAMNQILAMGSMLREAVNTISATGSPANPSGF